MHFNWLTRALPALLICTSLAAQDAPFQEVQNDDLPPTFRQLSTSRTDGSEATVFVTGQNRPDEGPLPLLIYVEGSGAQSLFYRLEDGRVAYGVFGLIAQEMGSQYRVAAVEKRGIEFGYMGQRGTGEGAPADATTTTTVADSTATTTPGTTTPTEGNETQVFIQITYFFVI